LGKRGAITTKLHQRATRAEYGTGAVISGWVDSINIFLKDNNLSWTQVQAWASPFPDLTNATACWTAPRICL